MISYAQNFEDVMLYRCFGSREDGFYIDVGAMDPVEHSVTKVFYDQGWSGINIEPTDWYYRKLLQERPRDINLKLGIGDREEARTMHVFEHFGISTFEQAHRDRFNQQGYESKEIEVRITTLAQVCRDYVRREIDFIKIDCEGWEKFVIAGADWDRFRPVVVIVEATEPNTTNPSWADWELMLTDRGQYQLVYFDGLNRYYLRREYGDLSRHFEAPPNVFDDAIPYSTVAARQAASAAAAERDAIMAERDAVIAERDRLLADVRNFEIEAANSQQQISELRNELSGLHERLRVTRLWAGQLSQQLAGGNRR